MEEVVWSLKSKEDLYNIFDFISKDSKLYAANTIDNIILRTKLLPSQKQSGRIVPEFNRGDIREVFEGNYRIIYVIKRKHIFISRVFHRSRLLKKL